MSSLTEFVSSTIKEIEENTEKLDELRNILEDLDDTPKIIYTSYKIIVNT